MPPKTVIFVQDWTGNLLVLNIYIFFYFQEKREIIVSLPCGMSVLRGANVYAQGIVGCPKGEW